MHEYFHVLQRIALAWMQKKENSLYCSGGILADDQVFRFFSGLFELTSLCAVVKSSQL